MSITNCLGRVGGNDLGRIESDPDFMDLLLRYQASRIPDTVIAQRYERLSERFGDERDRLREVRMVPREAQALDGGVAGSDEGFDAVDEVHVRFGDHERVADVEIDRRDGRVRRAWIVEVDRLEYRDRLKELQELVLIDEAGQEQAVGRRDDVVVSVAAQELRPGRRRDNRVFPTRLVSARSFRKLQDGVGDDLALGRGKARVDR